MDTKDIFQPAKLEMKKWRIMLRGTSGSGKTTSALYIATTLAEGGKVCLIDTEKLSSTHNAKRFKFDVVDYNGITKNDHNPERYIKLIDYVQENGYKVLVIDSFSHVWMGKNGILDIVSNLAETKYKSRATGEPNSSRAWKEGNDLYTRLIDKMLYGNNMHIILTGRTKMAYNYSGGKVEKRGMELQQREGIEYEFDTTLDFNTSMPGYAIPDKDRTDLFEKTGELIDENTGLKMLDYLK